MRKIGFLKSIIPGGCPKTSIGEPFPLLRAWRKPSQFRVLEPPQGIYADRQNERDSGA
jgi:hypothetical protein